MRAKILIYACSLITGWAFATSTLAQQFIHPKNNQTPEQQKKDEYNKARGACLEGKGYTVK